MKKIVLSLFVLTLLAGFSVTEEAWSKAHVPVNVVQVCNANGEVQNLNQNALDEALSRGACRLAACLVDTTQDLDNQPFIVLPGDTCDPTDLIGGFPSGSNDICDNVDDGLANVDVVSADGITALCTPLL